MVRVSIIVLAITSALSGLTAAKSCKSGGIYCGLSLLRKRTHSDQALHTGDYTNKIKINLRASNMDESNHNIQQSLWACGEHGDINLIRLCGAGCLDNTKQDDTCGEEEAAEAAAELKRDIAVDWVT
ncbi:hypothetical protein BKA64DRAFT_744264 [Cadophora sp. MPI-SDFR-AT-0126]|nr:hypothetical protein BKA64DRAFT_744264 [Leotiomycetes sp. MPI-SDFR-AT-0126]